MSQRFDEIRDKTTPNGLRFELAEPRDFKRSKRQKKGRNSDDNRGWSPCSGTGNKLAVESEATAFIVADDNLKRTFGFTR